MGRGPSLRIYICVQLGCQMLRSEDSDFRQGSSTQYERDQIVVCRGDAAVYVTVIVRSGPRTNAQSIETWRSQALALLALSKRTG